MMSTKKLESFSRNDSEEFETALSNEKDLNENEITATIEDTLITLRGKEEYYFRSFLMFAGYKIKRMFRLRSGISDISVFEAKFELDRDNLVFLDLRAKEDYENINIEKSIQMEIQNVKESLSELPEDKIIAVMCYGGGLSKAVTRTLVKNGFPNARNLKGGFVRWALDIDAEMIEYL